MIIRFYELTYPGKEILKATTWGLRNKILLRVVALKFPMNFKQRTRCNSVDLGLPEALKLKLAATVYTLAKPKALIPPGRL